VFLLDILSHRMSAIAVCVSCLSERGGGTCAPFRLPLALAESLPVGQDSPSWHPEASRLCPSEPGRPYYF